MTISRCQPGEWIELRLTPIEVLALCSAMTETFEALEDWEFRTRTGVDPAEMRQLRAEIQEARRQLAARSVSAGG